MFKCIAAHKQKYFGTATVLFSGFRFNSSLFWQRNRSFGPTWSMKVLFIPEISQPLDNLPRALNRTLAVISHSSNMYTWGHREGDQLKVFQPMINIYLLKKKRGTEGRLKRSKKTLYYYSRYNRWQLHTPQ